MYADAVVVKDTLLVPKRNKIPDKYIWKNAKSVHLVFVAGPNANDPHGASPSSTMKRTYNKYAATHYNSFREALKWTYYAGLHAMAMEGVDVALLCWVSGDLYAGPHFDTYGVGSDGSQLASIINEVLDMSCYYKDEASKTKGKSTLKHFFKEVVVVTI
jgi:hypothetical protein